MQHVNEEQLLAYIDNELAPADRRQVAAHVAMCAACAAQLVEWQALLGDVEALPDVALSVDLSERVVEALEVETALVTSPAVRWLAVAEGAVALAALLLGWPFVAMVSSRLWQRVVIGMNSAETALSATITDLSASISAGSQTLSTLPMSALSLSLSAGLLVFVLLIWLASTRVALRGLDLQS